MKILVVGGAGFLGGALTKLEWNARVYDNLLYEEQYLKNMPFVFGDVRDRKRLKEQLGWADCVIWLAGIVGDGACSTNPVLAKQVNQDAVKFLANNFKGRIIFTSTCSVYGASDDILDEDSPLNPLSVYASTKLEAEKYLKNKNAIIFRLGTLFGLGDEFSRIRLDLVVNTLTARAIQDGEITIFGGEQYRPLLHVKDAARAISFAINSKDTGIFNLYKENSKMVNLGKKVAKELGCKVKVIDTPFEDSRNYRVSSKSKFKPVYTVDFGIKEVARIIREGRIKDLNNPRYTNQAFMRLFNGTN